MRLPQGRTPSLLHREGLVRPRVAEREPAPAPGLGTGVSRGLPILLSPRRTGPVKRTAGRYLCLCDVVKSGACPFPRGARPLGPGPRCCLLLRSGLLCCLAISPRDLTAFAFSEGDLVFGEARCAAGPPFFFALLLRCYCVRPSVCGPASSPATSLWIRAPCGALLVRGAASAVPSPPGAGAGAGGAEHPPGWHGGRGAGKEPPLLRGAAAVSIFCLTFRFCFLLSVCQEREREKQTLYCNVFSFQAWIGEALVF